jgi:putative addiction module component (TIGR02574 family)
MPSSIAELEVQALQLTPEERAQLADHLLASLSSDEGIDQAWSIEADRRLAELESGTVAAVPVEDAIARARSAIR